MPEIAKLYHAPLSTFYRWKRTDEKFAKEFEDIVKSPLYVAKRKVADKGSDVIQDADKPRWSEPFVAYFRENGGRIVDACKHVGISYRMYKEAMDPSHPSYEPWFSDAIKELEEEHQQELRDEVRAKAKESPTLMKFILDKTAGMNPVEDGAGVIDDASILRILQQLKAQIEGEDAIGIPAVQPEPVPEVS